MTQRVAVPYLSSAGLASTSVGSSVSDQYGGPVGVQHFTQALGSHNSQFHLPPLPLPSNKQTKLLERLKQLRAWQQQQQADLLRQQQEQLLKLKNEQVTLEPMLSDQGDQDNWAKNADEDRTRTEETHKSTGDGANEEDGSGQPSKCRLSPDESEIVPESISGKSLEVHSDGEDNPYTYQHCANLQEDRAQWEPEICSVSDDEEHHTESDFRLLVPSLSQGISRDNHLTNEERPVQPVVGDFEHFIEQQITLDKSNSPASAPQQCPSNAHKPKKFSFLRRGEGIARFGMKTSKLKPKKPSKKSKSLSSLKKQCPPSTGVGPRIDVEQPSVSGVSHQPRIRKIARGQSTNNLSSGATSVQLPLPRMSSPTMVRCGSEDSFIVRRDDRLRREEEELLEFELLEMATVGDTPCPTSTPSSSRNSLDQAPPSFDVPLSPHSNLAPSTQSDVIRALSETPPLLRNTCNYDIDGNLRLLIDDCTTKEANLLTNKDAPDLMNNMQWQQQSDRSPDGHVNCEDLDETLTGPSVLAEVDFHDEEEWHSFSQGSPVAQVKEGVDFGSPNGSMVSVEVGASWSPPVKREQLNDQGLPIFQSPLPSATLNCVVVNLKQQQHAALVGNPLPNHEWSTQASIGSQNVPHVLSTHHSLGTTITGVSGAVPTGSKSAKLSHSNPSGSVETGISNTQQLHVGHDSHLQQIPPPPPSALVAKLFPALRKEKRPLDLSKKSNPAHAPCPHHADKTPSPTSSTGGDSGKGSLAAGSTATSVMNEELRRKLCLLETEIERFKSENAALEKLRVEKEEGLTHLKKEIAEFKRQKEEETVRFEEYKKEEIRKLKKERKMFETYQQQARTARDKKDKEDILILRNELQDLKEELRQRESRWGVAQSRLRLRIQSLEKENQELRNDLKMMEQTRLQLWQKQMEQEMKQVKRKKQLQHPKNVTTEISDDQNIMSDGCQSDGEGSDLSARAEEIANQVLADDQFDIVENQARHSTPSEEPNNPSDPALLTSSSEEMCSSKQQKATNKHVCFSVSPKRKERLASLPSKNVVSGTKRKQHGASPTKSKPLRSPVKSRAKEQRIGKLRDGITESSQDDGSRVILFPNGTRKIISPDKLSVSVYFFNGDVKHVKPDHTVVYFYAESKTTHTTYSDGIEVFDFPNGQCEKHYPNGTKEITFPDKTLKYVYPSGEEETNFPDGTVQKLLPDGNMTLFYANGQREIYTKEFKRREYPDGTVKTVYPDGRQETRYASGRVRVKDKEGRTLFDKLPDT